MTTDGNAELELPGSLAWVADAPELEPAWFACIKCVNTIRILDQTHSLMYCILLTLEAAEADFQDLQTRLHASAWANLADYPL